MALNSRLRWLGRTLLASPLHYALCVSEAEFYRELRRRNVAHPWPRWLGRGDASTHHFETNGTPIALVCAPPRAPGSCPHQFAALLCHEAVHLWQRAREALGETAPSAELEAYAVQWFAQELMLSHAAQTRRRAARKVKKKRV